MPDLRKALSIALMKMNRIYDKLEFNYGIQRQLEREMTKVVALGWENGE